MKKQKLNKNKDKALAYGEVTGHMHRVEVDVYELDNGGREFKGATTITHEEHKPITIPNKKWESGIVLEFDHLAQMERRVID